MASLVADTRSGGAPKARSCSAKRAKAAMEACSIKPTRVQLAASTAARLPVSVPRLVGAPASHSVVRRASASRSSPRTRKGRPALQRWLGRQAWRPSSARNPHWCSSGQSASSAQVSSAVWHLYCVFTWQPSSYLVLRHRLSETQSASVVQSAGTHLPPPLHSQTAFSPQSASVVHP